MKHPSLPARLGVLMALVAFGALALQAASGAPALAGPNCSPSGSAIDAAEQEMLTLINNHRQANGLGLLQFSDKLNKAAAWKSQHMADNSYFAHNDTPIGRTWTQRFLDCGYTYNTWIGENIAAGNETAAATFLQWKNSPGHNANMLSTNYTSIGIGRGYNASSPYDWYWTTDFGGYNDGYTPNPAATPTPTKTPTPLGPSGVRMPGTPPDSDGDGCSNSRELGPDAEQGGDRDPNNYWDFFDVPDATNRYDGEIGLIADIFGVVFRYGTGDNNGRAAINRNSNPLSSPPATGYHPAFDRSPAPPGAPSWELGPPDGEIDLFTDILGVAEQFGHSCT